MYKYIVELVVLWLSIDFFYGLFEFLLLWKKNAYKNIIITLHSWNFKTMTAHFHNHLIKY